MSFPTKTQSIKSSTNSTHSACSQLIYSDLDIISFYVRTTFAYFIQESTIRCQQTTYKSKPLPVLIFKLKQCATDKQSNRHQYTGQDKLNPYSVNTGRRSEYMYLYRGTGRVHVYLYTETVI